ncbi:lysylphosphatidylglycerol synthase transmembrane domain-containing protein [Phenylobacterium sp.]|uniref:lysylphosphatidylglycerol synthase transmembrane domain-containing protein n=1 Tax=Phenylobacterium sp. TaxID=1871053 RepID=UPI002F9395DF
MKAARILAGLAIAGLFAWLTLRGVDLAGVLAASRRLQPATLAGGSVAVALAFGLRILRWEVMLRLYRPSLRPGAAAVPLLVGFAGNNVLPFRLGDLVRVFGFARRLQIRPAPLVSSLLVERVLDLLALLLIAMLGAALLGGRGGPLVQGLAVLAGVTVAGASAVLWAAGPIVGLLLQGARLRRVRRVRILRRLLAFAARAAWSVAILRRRLLLLGTLSVAAWAAEGLVFLAILRGMGDTADARAWFALALGNLGTLLPGAPGHVGTFHFFAKEALVRYGTPPEVAAAEVILAHALLWMTVTAAGGAAYVLAWRRRSGD